MQQAVVSLLMRQLTRCFGQVAETRRLMITDSSIEELEQLGEALLTFHYLTDLDEWFIDRIK